MNTSHSGNFVHVNMSVALWYYCNLHDQVSAVVPVVQARQNAVKEDAKGPAVRSTDLLVSGDEVDGELAVARTTYVLSAALIEKVEAELVAEKKTVVDAEPAAVAESGGGEEPNGVESPSEVIEIKGAAVEAVQDTIEEVLVTKEEDVESVVEQVVESTAEAVAEETVHNVVETVVVVEKEIIEPIVAQAEVEEDKPVEVEIDEPTAESAASEVTKEVGLQVAGAEALAFPVLSSDVPDEKLVDKAEDVIAEPRKLVTRMPSIPEDEENVVGVEHEENTDVEQVDAVAAVEKTEKAVEEVLQANPDTDDESETETRSEISEATAIEAVESAPVVKTDEEPESEIDETMIIDPVVAAKEAVAAEAQTSSYSFIPEQLRKNSYAVSSVAVAITTAIVATLVARR